MDELLKTISSLSWWVGVVGVGFALNLLSAYAKSPIDTLLGSISRRWQDRTEKARSKRSALIKELRADKHLQVLYLAREQRRRMQELSYLALAGFFGAISLSLKWLDRLPLASGGDQQPAWLLDLSGGMAMLCVVSSFALRLSATTHMGLVEEAALGEPDR